MAAVNVWVTLGLNPERGSVVIAGLSRNPDDADAAL